METLNLRIADMSFHLQSLTSPKFSSLVQAGVERKDKNLLVKVCRKARIPEAYVGTIVSVLLSVGPDQKWPAEL